MSTVMNHKPQEGAMEGAGSEFLAFTLGSE